MRAAVAVLALLALSGSVPAAPPASVGPAIDFLHARQRSDGAVDDVWLSSWTAIALAAAGEDGHAFRAGGDSLAGYLAAHDAGYGNGVPSQEAARAVVAAVALGDDPRTFAGRDHVARLLSHFDGAQFGSPAALNDDVWAVFALRAAGFPADDARIQAAATTILAAQKPGGGWGLGAASFPEADMTAWALDALALAGRTVEPVDAAAVERGVAYLATLRGEGGAIAQCTEAGCGGPNAESTAAALAALRALGIEGDPRFSGLSDALVAFRRDDGAFYRFPSAGSWTFATPQSIVALAGASGYPPARRFDPSASLVPTAPVAGSPIALRAAADRCEWAVGDRLVAGCEASVTPARRGAIPVVLRAWTDGGGYVRAEWQIEVAPAPPRAALTSVAAAVRNAPVAFDASGSTDPDGAPASYRFEFGDGNGTDWQPTPWARHAYARSGVYSVGVAVRDADGLENATRIGLRVENQAPRISIAAPAACPPGVPIQVGATASDADGDDVRIVWTLPGARIEAATFERAFPEGTWTLDAVATDAEGATAAAQLVLECGGNRVTTPGDTVAVADAPARAPTIRLLAPSVVNASEPFRIDVSVDDEEPGWRLQLLLDGAALPTAAIEGGGRADVAGLAPGRHVVLARAIDADGLASEVATAHITAQAQAPAPESSQGPARAVPQEGLLLALLQATAAALWQRRRR